MSDTQVIQEPHQLTAADREAKKHAMIAYGLMLLGFFTGLSFLAGGIWGFVKKSDAQGTVFADHYDNIVKTFIISIVLSIISALTLVFLVGYLLLLITIIYVLFKVIKGLARLSSDKSYN